MSDGGATMVVPEAARPPVTLPGWRRHLLVLRFALFNVVAVGLLAVTAAQGWLDGALHGDTLWLCAVILAVFLYGMGLCALRIVATNRALNRVRYGAPSTGSPCAAYLEAVNGVGAGGREMQAGLLRLRLSHPIAIVRHVAGSLVFLGLVGTVIGFIIALSGVDPELTASVDKVAPMVSTLINGMSIALYTTLLGAVLHVWLMIAYRMLATASLAVYEATIELGDGVWDAEEFDDDGGDTVFRDVLLLALIGFIAMVIMMLPHLARKEQNTEEQKSPGNVVIEMHWPDDVDADVDLWVQAPNDIPVGFFNQGSRYFDLLRDDLGTEGDVTGKNYEISYSRGIPEGEYIVNVHMYGPLPSGTTIPVSVVVSVKRKFDSLQPIVSTDVTLTRRNQEETATRFRLTADGALVDGSVNSIRRRLVTAR